MKMMNLTLSLPEAPKTLCDGSFRNVKSRLKKKGVLKMIKIMRVVEEIYVSKKCINGSKIQRRMWKDFLTPFL